MSENIRLTATDGEASKQIVNVSIQPRRMVVSHVSSTGDNTTRLTYHEDGHAHLKLSMFEEPDTPVSELQGSPVGDFKGFLKSGPFVVPKSLEKLDTNPALTEDFSGKQFKMDVSEANRDIVVVPYLLEPGFTLQDIDHVLQTWNISSKFAILEDVTPNVGFVAWEGDISRYTSLPTASENFEDI